MKWPGLLAVVLLVWLCLQGGSAEEDGPQDIRLRALEPPSLRVRDAVIDSLGQLEEQFISFMSTVPLLWSNPRPVRHMPTPWRTRSLTREDTTLTTSGPCNAPFGYPFKEPPVDPCGPEHECRVSGLVCNGKSADPTKMSAHDAQQQNCTAHKLECLHSSYAPQLPTEGCQLRSLNCPTQDNATLGQCTVKELSCPSFILGVGQPNTSFCTSTTIGGLPCKEGCTPISTNKDVCGCSMDRMGETCAEWRPYSCNVTLLAPQPHCQPSILDADPVCFLYSRWQTQIFNYTIHCAFSNTTGIKDSIAHDSIFNYTARRNDEFAVSWAQNKSWILEGQLCVYDFNRLGDRQGCINIPLSPKQLAADAPISYAVNFAKLEDRYFAGNRIYFEVGLSKSSQFQGRVVQRDRRFIDFTDVKISRSVDESLSKTAISWIIVGTICAFCCVVCTAFTVRRRIEKYKLKRRIKKLE